MTLLPSAIPVDDHKTDEPAPRRFRAHLRVSLAAAIATAIVAMAMLSGHGRSARGDDKGSSKPGTSAPAAGSYWAFISMIDRVLKSNDDRLIELVKSVLGNGEAPNPGSDELPAVDLQVESAEARYKSAKLDREAAKLALREYDKGTFVREQAIEESEIQCARNKLEARGKRSRKPRNDSPTSGRS